MSITYLVDLNCPVKEQVRASKMMRLLYQRDRANEALNKARKKAPGVTPDLVKVNLTIKDAKGKTSLAVTTAVDILGRFGELDAHSNHCRACPARMIPAAFGCRGEISFPLSLRSEAWLMGLIHGNATDPTPKMLLNYLASNGILGHRPAEMRRMPEIYFESEKALARRYDTGEKMSVNQIFELLFLTEKIGAKHARFLLSLFDLYESNLPLDGDASEFNGVRVFERTEGGSLVSRAGLKALPDAKDDRSTRELKQYFYGMFIACELGCDLLVSV